MRDAISISIEGVCDVSHRVLSSNQLFAYRQIPLYSVLQYIQSCDNGNAADISHCEPLCLSVLCIMLLFPRGIDLADYARGISYSAVLCFIAVSIFLVSQQLHILSIEKFINKWRSVERKQRKLT